MVLGDLDFGDSVVLGDSIGGSVALDDERIFREDDKEGTGTDEDFNCRDPVTCNILICCIK